MHLNLAAYCTLPVLMTEASQVQFQECLKYLGKRALAGRRLFPRFDGTYIELAGGANLSVMSHLIPVSFSKRGIPIENPAIFAGSWKRISHLRKVPYTSFVFTI